MDHQSRSDLSILPRNIFLAHSTFTLQLDRYLSSITTLKFRRALSLARLNALSTAVIEGKYQNIPFEPRLAIEMKEQVILYCFLYADAHQELLFSF